jgi:uncharacterized protein
MSCQLRKQPTLTQGLLTAAVISGHLEVVRLLLERGAYAKNPLAIDALVYAATEGPREMVELLIDGGADINGHGRTFDGETPLTAAATFGRVEVVELLLARGADISAQDQNSRTALMAADSEGHGEVVALLRAHGAD